MHIIVLIKAVTDLNVWVEVDPETQQPDPHDLVRMPNPSDLTSLSLALRLASAVADGSVTVLLLGPDEDAPVLQKCLEYGAGRAVHLQTPPQQEFEGSRVAVLLAETIRQKLEPCDVLLSGRDLHGALPGSGQVGTQVGTRLGLPQIPQATRVEADSDGSLQVRANLSRGDQALFRCRPPVHLGIHPEAARIEYPPLAPFLATAVSKIECLTPGDLRLDASEMTPALQITATATPRPRPKRVFTPASTLSAAERMRQVMSGGLKKKRSEYVQGNPQQQARHVIDFLIQNNLLPAGHPKRANPKNS